MAQEPSIDKTVELMLWLAKKAGGVSANIDEAIKFKYKFKSGGEFSAFYQPQKGSPRSLTLTLKQDSRKNYEGVQGFRIILDANTGEFTSLNIFLGSDFNFNLSGFNFIRSLNESIGIYNREVQGMLKNEPLTAVVDKINERKENIIDGLDLINKQPINTTDRLIDYVLEEATDYLGIDEDYEPEDRKNQIEDIIGDLKKYRIKENDIYKAGLGFESGAEFSAQYSVKDKSLRIKLTPDKIGRFGYEVVIPDDNIDNVSVSLARGKNSVVELTNGIEFESIKARIKNRFNTFIKGLESVPENERVLQLFAYAQDIVSEMNERQLGQAKKLVTDIKIQAYGIMENRYKAIMTGKK